jgi:hypothetical protein
MRLDTAFLVCSSPMTRKDSPSQRGADSPEPNLAAAAYLSAEDISFLQLCEYEVLLHIAERPKPFCNIEIHFVTLLHVAQMFWLSLNFRGASGVRITEKRRAFTRGC